VVVVVVVGIVVVVVGVVVVVVGVVVVVVLVVVVVVGGGWCRRSAPSPIAVEAINTTITKPPATSNVVLFFHGCL